MRGKNVTIMDGPDEGNRYECVIGQSIVIGNMYIDGVTQTFYVIKSNEFSFLSNEYGAFFEKEI